MVVEWALNSPINISKLILSDVVVLASCEVAWTMQALDSFENCDLS